MAPLRTISMLMLMALCAFAVAACGDDGGEDTLAETTDSAILGDEADDDAGASEELTISLDAQGDEGLSGTATLTAEDAGGTQVVVELDDPDGTARPAHVHPGTCEELDPAPAYPLESVVDGMSETMIDAEIDELLAEDHAINVHLSDEDIDTYIACGDISG